MRKVFILILIISSFLFFTNVTYAVDNENSSSEAADTVDKIVYPINQSILNIANKPYMSAREFGENLGGNFKWYAKEKAFVVAANDIFACFFLKENLALVREAKLLYSQPLKTAIKHGNLYLPTETLDIFRLRHTFSAISEKVYISSLRHVYDKELNDFAYTAFQRYKKKNNLLGEFTTYFNTSLINRTTNIKLASKNLDNLVIEPGKIFSFNKTLGARTPKAGYKKAIVFVNKEKVEDYGGGICQVSSTLFNAVDMARLQVLERRSHSIDVTYVPKGKDATVSYGYIDFVFENTKPFPIILNTQVIKNRLTVKISRLIE